jgi:hypothetical protein
MRVLVLLTTDWSTIRQHVADVVAALNMLRPGQVLELSFT